MRCEAIKKDGDQCSREVKEGSKYCWQHQTKKARENKSITREALREKVAEMVANPEIKNNYEIYESLNISEATFYRWMNEQEFINLVNNKIDKYTDKELPNVWTALIRKAKAGDTNAIKLYFEMKNKYKQRVELGINELPTINLVRGDGDGS